ncbi:MAG: TonB-dependent receptor [Bacteroidales bacterium]
MQNPKLFISLLMAAALMLLTGYQAYSSDIQGQVVDEDGNRLPSALLEFVNVDTDQTFGTTTNIDGEFQITVDPGTYNVRITYMGYQEKTLTVDATTDQDLERIVMVESAIGLQEVMVVSSYARDRETPVAISNISAEEITERLGTMEFPQLLQSTPSVYATREAGGFGDGRINMRGFDSNNIGVLVNGVPVNDMENGRVYWSNWAGLSDVTETMQVQRGLGASRLAISSVGGTINIITQSTDANKGGSLRYGIGHDGYREESFSLSTGTMDNGWAITALGARRSGEGFVRGLDFKGWSYFLNVSKEINSSHTLSLTAFGAPQWHNQRWPRQRIQTYRDHPDGIRYNPSLGVKNGDKISASYNQYHKPQVSLNHYWSINPNTTLSTAYYLSISSGGGRRIYGERSDWLEYNRDTGLPTDETKLTPNGLLDFDAVMEANALSETGSQAIQAMAVNAHDWYGMLSTLQHEYDENITFTGGLDLRYYKGYHYQKITDLLGGTHFEDFSNINRDNSTRLQEEDKVNYHNLGEVMWGGLFAQAEYVTDDYSAFVSTTGSITNYRRTDYFQYADDDPIQQSDWVDFFAWSLKGGGNYNITDHHNVFANIGYFTRAPFFRWAFVGYTNTINEDVKHERVFSTETGYGLRTELFAANVILYRTEWLDKALVRNLGQGVIANVTGLNALHQGVEVDFTLRPTDDIEVRGMFSYGDWKWQDDLTAEIYDENQVLLDSIEVYAGGLRVGNSAQTTAAIGASYEIFDNLRIGFDANHYDRLFADFNVEDRGDIETRGEDSWQMPSYQMMDVNMRYRFQIAGMNASLIANVNNVFDTEAIRDATDGRSFDYDTALVYYGWGRSWTTTLKIDF